ncbi:hypothetical protein [Salinispira pacifica]|uniref:Uncharacterized protein n=1 Tax=Salinispira pacifica TaxID=1307761 RepID=V5WCM1_9SPIO|nr:hypothetical protein [Salinispira pacifica]AHC13512.1 hypothetical protein L21SP2_0066 [Salinispira pacifica]
MTSKNTTPSLSDHDRELLMRVQALVDNEIPGDEIDTVIAEIENNHRLRDEYIRLLRLKRELSKLPKLELRREWYEEFEKKPRYKRALVLGTIFAVVYIISSLIMGGFALMDRGIPHWVRIGAVISLGGTVVSFLVHTYASRRKEMRDDRNYKDIIR